MSDSQLSPVHLLCKLSSRWPLHPRSPKATVRNAASEVGEINVWIQLFEMQIGWHSPQLLSYSKPLKDCTTYTR